MMSMTRARNLHRRAYTEVKEVEQADDTIIKTRTRGSNYVPFRKWARSFMGSKAIKPGSKLKSIVRKA